MFIYHSAKLVNIAAINPKVLKLSSNELHNAKPSIIGNRLSFVQNPVNSRITRREIITVNNGDDDLIVSTNEIDECFNATKHNIIEKSL